MGSGSLMCRAKKGLSLLKALKEEQDGFLETGTQGSILRWEGRKQITKGI